MLTAKEWLIAELVTQGMKNPQIAEIVGTSESVIKNCMRDIFDKLGLWNRTELALWYVHQKG